MIVYKQYDQDALNRQYNNRLQVPDHPVHTAMWEKLSAQTEKELPVKKDVQYGDHPRERMDIYPSPVPGSKTLIFIHGGYWRNLDKSFFQFVAKAFHPYNITVVVITYPLAPEVSIDQIVLSCRKAVQWVHKNIIAYHGDADQLYVAGHSAGGHLAAMMMTDDKIIPPVLLKGVCSMSGLFNLVPIQLSDINETLHMDKDMALRNSPVYLRPVIHCPLLLIVGADETEEYKSQGEELNDNWKQIIPVETLQLKGVNHFSIAGDLLDNHSLLHRKMREMMNV
jgi:arylformamidase